MVHTCAVIYAALIAAALTQSMAAPVISDFAHRDHGARATTLIARDNTPRVAPSHVTPNSATAHAPSDGPDALPGIGDWAPHAKFVSRRSRERQQRLKFRQRASMDSNAASSKSTTKHSSTRSSLNRSWSADDVGASWDSSSNYFGSTRSSPDRLCSSSSSDVSSLDLSGHVGSTRSSLRRSWSRGSSDVGASCESLSSDGSNFVGSTRSSLRRSWSGGSSDVGASSSDSGSVARSPR